MLTRLTITGLLLFGLGLGAAQAEEKAKPDPDFCPVRIQLPEQGLARGANQLKVTIENKAKDSVVEGKVKFELVVLGQDDSRQSYFGEFDAMRFGQKREVTIEGIEVDTLEPVRFLVIVDPENLVRESNEHNNRFIFQARIKGPKIDAPKVEEPKAETPTVEEPEAETPALEEPKIDEPGVEEPNVEEPEVEERKTETPTVEP